MMGSRRIALSPLPTMPTNALVTPFPPPIVTSYLTPVAGTTDQVRSFGDNVPPPPLAAAGSGYNIAPHSSNGISTAELPLVPLIPYFPISPQLNSESENHHPLPSLTLRPKHTTPRNNRVDMRDIQQAGFPTTLDTVVNRDDNNQPSASGGGDDDDDDNAFDLEVAALCWAPPPGPHRVINAGEIFSALSPDVTTERSTVYCASSFSTINNDAANTACRHSYRRSASDGELILVARRRSRQGTQKSAAGPPHQRWLVGYDAANANDNARNKEGKMTVRNTVSAKLPAMV